MRLDSFGAIIKAALVAGLAAGLLVAAVQYVWTEPIVDRAISLEEQLHSAENNHVPAASAPAAEDRPVVDRPTQKKGLFLGYTIYGLAWGLLFGAAYTVVQGQLPLRRRLPRGLIVAAASFWAVGFLPFLKYPGNPPGVGDPQTIDFRQQAYFGILLGGIVLVALALIVFQALVKRGGGWQAQALPLVLVAVGSTLLYVLMPANTDPIRMPAALVSEFRMHSLVGLGLFWLVLGLVFGPLLAWLDSPEASRRNTPVPAANR